MMRRLLLLVGVFIVLFLVAAAVHAASGTTEPSHTLTVDGTPYAYVWEAGGAEYVYGEVQRFCPCFTQNCLSTPSFTQTATKVYPTQTNVVQSTPTPVACAIWVCHKPGTAAEQDYCCWDSEGCFNAHIAHGDYEGKCQ